MLPLLAFAVGRPLAWPSETAMPLEQLSAMKLDREASLMNLDGARLLQHRALQIDLFDERNPFELEYPSIRANASSPAAIPPSPGDAPASAPP